MLLDWLFPLLVFVPGITLIFLISRKLKIHLDFLELILLGFTVWHFVLIAPALLLGLFSNALIQYFSIYTLVSIIMVVILVVYILVIFVKTKPIKIHLPLQIKIKLPIQNSRYLIFPIIVCLSFFILLLTLFAPVYASFDTLALYLPSAKSIILTGGLQHDVFHLTDTLTAHSPLMPLTYSWALSAVGPMGISAFPVVFFFMILIATFLTAKKLMPQHLASISTLTLIVVPATLVTMVCRSLYLDIAFVSYLIITLFIAMKAAQSKTVFYYILMSISMCLLILARFEFGIFIAPSFIAILMFSKSNKLFNRIVGTILCSSSFWALFIYDVVISELPFDTKYGMSFSVLPLLIVYSVVIFVLSGRIGEHSINFTDKFEAIKKGILLFLPLIPVFIFLLNNYFELNCLSTLFSWNPEYVDTVIFYNNVLNQQSSGYSILAKFRWDNLFLSEALVAPFFIPFLIGLLYILRGVLKRKLTENKLYFLIVFSAVFICWSWLLNCDGQIRRLFIFAPFVSIIIAFGTYKFASFFGSTKHLLSRYAIYAILVFTIIWVLTFNADTFNIFLNSYNLFTQTDSLDLIIFSLIFTAVIPISCKLSKKLPRFSILKSKILSTITPLLCLLLIITVLVPPVSDVFTNGAEIRDSIPNRIQDVADYYNSHIDDSYTTVVFFAHELIWYANRTIIDLSGAQYSIQLTPYLKEENKTLLLDSLIDADIRYFLVPKKDVNYNAVYEALLKNTLLFRIMYDDPQFKLIKEFKYFELFKLLSVDDLKDDYLFIPTQNNYDIEPLNNWSKIANSSSGVLVYGEGGCYDSQIFLHAQTSFLKTNHPLITLNNAYVDERDCLQIQVNHAEGNKFLYYDFNSSIDLSMKSYLSFWFYGANTNAILPMVLHTNMWTDCFKIDIKDDFTGWQHFFIPLSNVSIYRGAPSWDNIIRFDLLLGNIPDSQEYFYYLTNIELSGLTVGAIYNMPPLSNVDQYLGLVIDVQILNDSYTYFSEIRSDSGTLLSKNLLKNGRTLIELNSAYLLNGNNDLILSVNVLADGQFIILKSIAFAK